MMGHECKNIVSTPKGAETRSNPIDGFQIITLQEFFEIQAIPDEVKQAHHQLGFDLIWICTNGQGIHHVDFTAYDFKEYSVFLIRKGQYHAWEINTNNDGYLIFIESEYYAKMGQNISSAMIQESSPGYNSPHFEIKDKEDQLGLRALLKLIQKEYNKKVENNKVLNSYVNALFMKIEHDYFEAHPGINRMFKGSLFLKFQTVLKEHISQSRNGSYYCELLGVSFSELNNKCKLVTGFTLKAYIDLYLVTVAKRKLINSERNISQVAFELGFDEIGNFSKFFRKHTNSSPKEFIALNIT